MLREKIYHIWSRPLRGIYVEKLRRPGKGWSLLLSINVRICIKNVKKFAPSKKQKEREEELKNHPERNFTLSLPYTSFRCDKIAQK